MSRSNMYHANRIILSLAVFASTVVGQSLRFSDATRSLVPQTRVRCGGVAVADFDRNGSPDIFGEHLGFPNPDLLWLNDGHGVFRDAASNLPSSPFRLGYFSVAVDVDRDGDADLLIGTGSQRPFHLLLNDGRGRFVDVTFERVAPHLMTGTLRRLVPVDIDADGDQDVLITREIGNLVTASLLVYRNDGKGNFADATQLLPRETEAIRDATPGDVDGDGDLDLVLATTVRWDERLARYVGGQTQLYLHDGKGGWANATRGRMPLDGDESSDIELADVDGDRDLDILVANTRLFSGTGQNRLYLNDGRGSFTDGTRNLPPDRDGSVAVAAADLNGDGAVDLFWSNQGQNRLYVNGGRGFFQDATLRLLPVERVQSSFAVLDDMDRDGDVDVVVSNVFHDAERVQLLLNDGRAGFTDVYEPGVPFRAEPTRAAVLFDADGDQTLDLAIAAPGDLRLWIGRGNGMFRPGEKAFPNTRGSSVAIAAGDVTGDGFPDLFVGNAPGPNFLFTSANGYFGDRSLRLPTRNDLTMHVAIADVDGDGVGDMIEANWRGQNRLYLGTRQLSRVRDVTERMPKESAPSLTVLAFDGDGDGDVDLLFGNASGGDSFYRNDGKGNFTAGYFRLPTYSRMTRAFVAADIERDGDLDLFHVNGTGSNELWTNEGGGRFVLAQNRGAFGRLGRAAAFLDLDEDGDLDLVVIGDTSDASPNRPQLFLNDGKGVFQSASVSLPAKLRRLRTLATGDVDSDGDPDLFLGTAGHGEDVVWLNRHRQVAAPLIARAGHAYHLDITSQPGYATGSRLLLPMFAADASRATTPYGVFQLDSRSLVIGAPLSIAVNEDSKRLSLPLPRRASLVGQTFASQVLVLSGVSPVEWRLTNAVRETIR